MISWHRLWILDAVTDTESEPDCDATLELVLAELERREPIFHRREFGTTREDFDRLTDVNFWETGASGRRYSREHVWAVLGQRYASDPTGRHDSDWTTSEFELREIASNTYLLTYFCSSSTTDSPAGRRCGSDARVIGKSSITRELSYPVPSPIPHPTDRF